MRTRALTAGWFGAAITAACLTGCGDDQAAENGSSGGSSGGSTDSGETTTSTGETGSETGFETEGTETETGDELACQEIRVGTTPLRRLTRTQYANAVRDALGLVAETETLDADEKAGAFDSNYSASVSPDAVEQYRAVAEGIATESVGSPESVEAIAPCQGTDSACWADFVDTLGLKLFRRPVTELEHAAYTDLAATGDDYKDGVRLVVQAMLQSGNFLYHLEFGLPDAQEGVAELTQYEVASRLSFFLWNSIPDESLLTAAAANELDSSDAIRAHAERLLADPKARDAVGSFHVQWLALDHLESAYKDPAYYPEWSPELADAMIAETRRFSQIVVLQGDGKLDTLLTANYSYLDEPLFELYGVEAPPGHNVGVPVQLDPSERAGLLTHAGFLSEHALTNASGPIQRGVEVRTNILCNPPPPPPPGAATPPKIDENSTTREIFEQHTKDDVCAACHLLIDGIGLGFEAYDGIGAYRTTENGKPIDDLGEVVGTDVDGEFDGAVELAARLAQSQEVRECVSRQWFRFAFGRFEVDADECSLELMNEAFEASDYNVRELLLQVVATDAFRFKAAE